MPGLHLGHFKHGYEPGYGFGYGPGVGVGGGHGLGFLGHILTFIIPFIFPFFYFACAAILTALLASGLDNWGNDTDGVATKATSSRPHLFLVLVDDLGYHDVSWSAAPATKIQTPNLQSLRTMGTSLENYYTQSSCTPSRTSLMTGRYPHRMGMQTAMNPGEADGLDISEYTLANKLKDDGGYKTHLVGKWHLGFCDQHFVPTWRGFDTFYGLYQGAGRFYMHDCPAGLAWADPWVYDLHYQDRPNCGTGCSQVQWDAQGYYSSDLFYDQAKSIIKKHDPSTPLFLYLSFQTVHSPMYEVPDPYLHKYDSIFPGNPNRSQFAGMMEYTDMVIGKLVQEVRNNKLIENAVMGFSTDNGGPIDDWDFAGSSNYPLRGGKQSTYEGGVRCGVGFLVGKGVPVGSYNGMFHMVDWWLTYASAAGLTATSKNTLDSISAWGYFDKLNYPRTKSVLNIFKGSKGGLRSGNYKYLYGYQIGCGGSSTGPCGLFSLPDGGVDESQADTNVNYLEQLYDLTVDATESNNLAYNSAYASVVSELRTWYLMENASAKFPHTLGAYGYGTVQSNGRAAWVPWLEIH